MQQKFKLGKRRSILILIITILVLGITTGIAIAITSSRHAKGLDNPIVEIPSTGEITTPTQSSENSETVAIQNPESTAKANESRENGENKEDKQKKENTETTDVKVDQSPTNAKNVNANESDLAPANAPAPQVVSLVQTVTREESSVTTNYGTKIITTNINAYEIYSDGSEKLINSTPEATKYDFSTFHATAQEMWNEAASQVVAENANIQQVLAKTNFYRAEIGSDPLVLDANLSAVANIRAIELAWSNTFSHTRPNGQICFSLAQEIGIPFYGENLAYGDGNQMDTGDKAADAWRHSEGHYMNMVATRFKKLGVGVYKFSDRYYFVQLFDE